MSLNATVHNINLQDLDPSELACDLQAFPIHQTHVRKHATSSIAWTQLGKGSMHMLCRDSHLHHVAQRPSAGRHAAAAGVPLPHRLLKQGLQGPWVGAGEAQPSLLHSKTLTQNKEPCHFLIQLVTPVLAEAR